MTKLTKPEVNITKDDWLKAESFRPNCGPAALAVIAQIPILQACTILPGFANRHFTNPTMMAAALRTLGIWAHERDDIECEGHTLTRYGLCRLQWEGPWTAPGMNPKWAYRHTHWVAAAEFNWPEPEPILFVFDVNFGWQTFTDWEQIHIPKLIKEIEDKRATGNWWATHRWELE